MTSDADGSPVAGVLVTARLVYPQGSAPITTRTDDQGRYSMAVASGSYTVVFEKERYSFAQYGGIDPFALVTVDQGPVVADLEMARLADLVGTVTGPDGPVAGARVTLWESFGAWQRGLSARTDASGRWRIETVCQTCSYRVGFEADGLLPEFFPDRAAVELAADVQLKPGETRVDAVLARGEHEVGGRLTVLGDPVAAAVVYLLAPVEGGSWREVDRTMTMTDGGWRFTVPAGRYRVQFGNGGAVETWAPVPWRDADGGEALDVAGDVRDLDLDLPGNVVQGRVTGEGAPLMARVGLSIPLPVSPVPADCFPAVLTYTDALGRYAFVGLSPGTFFLDASVPGDDTWLPSDVDGPVEGCPGMSVWASPGHVTTRDVDLRRAASPSSSPTASPTSVTPVAPVAPRPLVLGSARVGGLLLGLALPRKGTTISRQWLRNGVPVTGATGLLHVVRRQDRGTELSLRVTYRRAGQDEMVGVSRELKVR